MILANQQILLAQGCTFRQSFTCDLTDQGVADIAPWAVTSPTGSPTANAFDLSFKLRGDTEYRPMNHAYVSFAGNVATITVTKEATYNFTSDRGRFRVEASNGVDRFCVIEGGWAIRRTNAVPTTLQCAYENVDGQVEDCASMPDATSQPGRHRVWLAQGRCRAAVRVSDGVRMNTEDVYFRATGLAAREKPMAVEVDPTQKLLYTLTNEGGLYCESIVDETIPVQATPPLSLVGFLTAGEVCNDLKIYTGAGEEVIVLATSRRIVLIKNDGASLSIVSWTTALSVAAPLTDANPNPLLSVNPLLVIDIQRVAVAKDNDNRVVAYVQCSCRGYELVPATRPFSQVVVLCDLDLAGSYAAPHFTTPGAPYCVFYNPFPVAPSGWTALYNSGIILGVPTIVKTDYHVFDLKPFDDAGTKWLFVAHGRRNQVRKVNVSNAFTVGLAVGASIPCHPLFPADPTNCQNISHVDVHPTNVNHFLVIEEDNDGARVVDLAGPTVTLLANTRFGNGGPRDNAVIALAGKPFTVWSFDITAVDFTFRAIDASTNTPTALFEKYWFMNSDGMVALPPHWIYQITFGGVVVYKRTGPNGEWWADEAGYQPARVDDPLAPGTWLSSNTETVDMAYSVSAPGDNRLLTASADIGFMEYKVDAATGRPGPARAFTVPPFLPHPLFPDWTDAYESSGAYYSNDVTWAIIDGQHFVFMDVTNRRLSQWALVAWKYVAISDTWVIAAVTITQTSYPTYTIPLSGHVHITRDLPNNKFAVIGTDGAFFLVLLDELVKYGRMSAGPVHYTASIAPDNQHGGAVTSLGALFVSLYAPGGNTSQGVICVYNFNTATGVVDFAHPRQIFNSSSVSLPAGQTWDKMFKIRFRQLDAATGRGALYVCGAGGVLIELAWDPLGGLTFKSSWKSDYVNALCDAHGYDFGDGYQLLVSKNIEGFALIRPSVE